MPLEIVEETQFNSVKKLKKNKYPNQKGFVTQFFTILHKCSIDKEEEM